MDSKQPDSNYPLAAIRCPPRYINSPAMDQCVLTVLVTPGEAPIRCRRRVWEQDPGSRVCYSCHPRGRERTIEDAVRRVLDQRPSEVGAMAGHP